MASDPAGAVVEWIISHLMLFVWIFALGFIVLGVMIAIHSFVEAGSTQIFVDGERKANKGGDLRAFSIDRWLAGGASSWWRIFWIYNLAWSVGLIFVLVPLLLTIIGMLAISDTTGRVVIGCAGVAVAVLVLIPVGIVTSIWCTKAITICVARSLPARESLSAGWRAIKGDLGRHLAVAVILFVISMAINSFVSAFSIPMNMNLHQTPTVALMFAPARIVIGSVQRIVSASIGTCRLACFVSLT